MEIEPQDWSQPRRSPDHNVAVPVKSGTGTTLGGILHQRWRALESSSHGLVAVGVFEKYSVTAANRSFTIAHRVPGKTDARGRIKEMTRRTTCRNTSDAALDQPICSISQNCSVTGVERRRSLHILSGIKIECLQLRIGNSSVQADSQAQVQRQMWRDSPVVLKVGLEDFVAQIIFGLAARLAKRGIVTREQIRKRVLVELEKLESNVIKPFTDGSNCGNSFF